MRKNYFAGTEVLLATGIMFFSTLFFPKEARESRAYKKEHKELTKQIYEIADIEKDGFDWIDMGEVYKELGVEFRGPDSRPLSLEELEKYLENRNYTNIAKTK